MFENLNKAEERVQQGRCIASRYTRWPAAPRDDPLRS